jgi:energy-coupling factor transporter ATP-binding protein EcfA2
MQNFYYKINEFKIKLSIPEKIELYKLQSQIPGIELEDKPDGNLDLHFIFLEGNEYEVVNSDKKIVLYGKWSANVKADIPHFLYCILRNYWVENAQYPVHSIMFKNSLLIGHSGSGKTTLALEALNQNIEVQSYDKTVVKFTNKKLMMVAGTKVITIRKKLFEKNSSIFKDKEVKDIGDRFLIEQTSVSSMSKRNIKKLYFFSLADSELFVNKFTSLSSIHELYSFFLDSTKIDVIIDGGRLIYDGCNSTDAKAVLVNHLENWLSKGNFVEMLVGTKQDIVRYVKNNNSKEVK